MSVKIDFPSLAEKYGSPLYLFDFDAVKKRVQKIKNHLPSNARLCYAIKANAFFVQALKDEDILFEVCSPGELSICEKANLSPDKIVFSGVVKNQDDVKRAYNLNVHTITLESVTHCQYLINAINTEKYHPQNVIIRLTCGNQFGMSKDDVYTCVKMLSEYKNITIRGIHFFTGTQKKIKKIEEEVSFIQDFCNQLKKDTGLNFSDIEYGPGLSFDYFSQADESKNYTDLDSFSDFIKSSSYRFVVELGRFVASPCGYYLTKIMDHKGDEKNKYCIIDGGINHINYYGQMMGMKIPKIEHISSNAITSEKENYTIAGSLCTTADIVLRQLPLSSPAIGDLLIFDDIGAYSITEGIYLFLSHPLPAVLCMDSEKIIVLRNIEETYKINS